MPDPADKLHPFLLEHCFSYLPLPDLVSAFIVSPKCRVACSPTAAPSGKLWKAAFLRDADYEHGDLRLVEHLERGRKEYLEYHAQWGTTAENSAASGNSSDEEDDCDKPSDYDPDEYRVHVTRDEIADEWRRLCLHYDDRGRLVEFGRLKVHWSPHIFYDKELELVTIDSENDSVILLPTPWYGSHGGPRLYSFDRQTLAINTYKYGNVAIPMDYDDVPMPLEAGHVPLPVATHYRIHDDRNVGLQIHRFRNNGSTRWVELFLRPGPIRANDIILDEIGDIPGGALKESRYPFFPIKGFYPYIAINLDGTGQGFDVFQVYTSRFTDGTVGLWVRAGDQIHGVARSQGVFLPPKPMVRQMRPSKNDG
ncbi:uncharacterized protein LOC62_07G009734 [Vanrija pseudolonga]|uniref:F-box domain-containing protein n=1 Tax=Vanrija pseudolonga TaxID=143232 RepID=A0AAF1BRU1_9TREE|nr:hypothetical protein LOC62_07G009734 [Vanrija pseudolonga]